MKKLSAEARKALITTLRERFNKNPSRHSHLKWQDVESRLEKEGAKLTVLQAMEESGGEPDVIGIDNKTKSFIFCDCSAESPKDRRSLCYDAAALAARKENKPKGNAEEGAAEMGAELLDEEQYKFLQTVVIVDQKTSSWLRTPADVRKKGGAIFGDYRYGRVFIYHNGAESYYAARGYRCRLLV
jgi:hypothetical protein